MRLRKPLLLLLAVAVVAASALFAYRYTHALQRDNLAVLSYLPRDPDAVIYVDITALRQSPFLAQLSAWAPQPQQDPDYAQFVQDTGFSFERDLDHLAIVATKSVNASSSANPAGNAGSGAMFFIGEGRFDRNNISAYAQRTGVKHNIDSHETFWVPLDADKSTLAFAFVSDRILIASNGATQLPAEMFSASRKTSAPSSWNGEWRERFARLAGSPVFAVIRQDAAASLADRAPGGFRSPQLSSLLEQLQWITMAAKPDADQLRLVAEGESASDATARQLADVLNGILIFAQAGLSDPKVRQQLAPDVRQGFLDLLKSADVSKLDRGETKSVRVVFSITPQFLEAAGRYSLFYTPSAVVAKPGARNPPAAPSSPHKSPARKSGT